MNLPRPPLGLRPRSIAVQQRTAEVREAIKRYESADLPVPPEWRVELSCLIEQADVRGCATPVIYGNVESVKANADGSVTLEVRHESARWARWHRTANRLAPPGVSVQIRDRSGEQVVSWAFGGPQKPPFSVKSWRFSYESDARHYEQVWAAVPAGARFKQAQVKTFSLPPHLEPTEKMKGRVFDYGALRELGWTDLELVAEGFYRLVDPQAALRRAAMQEDMPGMLACLRELHTAAPPTVEQRDWMATRWRQTTMPGVDIPKGIKVEVILEPSPSVITRWRFTDPAEARTYDAKQGKS